MNVKYVNTYQIYKINVCTCVYDLMNKVMKTVIKKKYTICPPTFDYSTHTVFFFFRSKQFFIYFSFSLSFCFIIFIMFFFLFFY